MSRRMEATRLTPPASGGALRVLADGLVMAAVLVGLLFSLCSAYELEVDRTGLLAVCLLLTALTLLVYELPHRRWLAMLILAVLYGYAGWRWQDELIAGACVAADQVLSVLDMELQINLVWMTGSRAELLWFLSMGAALLCVPLGWAVVRGRSAGLTVVLSLPWLLPAMLLEHFPSWLPLMVLTAGWCTLLLAGLCGRDDPAGGARMVLICLPSVAALLAVLSVALPRAGYERPRWADSVRTALADSALEFVGSGGPLGEVAALMSGGDQVSVRLDDAGPRTFQNQVVLEVESEYTGRLYLRGTSAGRYTGTAWEPLSDVAYSALGLGDDSIRDRLNGYQPLNFPAMTASGLPYYEMTISYPSSMSGWMYTPYQLLTSPDEISDVTFVDDSHLERQFGVREKNIFFVPEALPTFDAVSSLSWDAAEAEAAYRSFVYDQYLDVPEGFEESFYRWQNAMMAEDPAVFETLPIQYDELLYRSPHGAELLLAEIAAAMLEVSTAYDLDTPYTPEGEDFVDYFLNGSRRGYCVHYASAGVLLIRYWGVPARYVTGYTVNVPASGTAEVLDSDAHAWVEIYLDGYGWYPVEMTPSAGTGITSESPMTPESVAPVAEDPVEEPDEIPGEETPPEAEPEAPPETPDDRPEPSKTEDREESPAEPDGTQPTGEAGRPWALWIAAAVALVLLAAPVRAAGCCLLRRRTLYGRNTNQAVLSAYGWLDRLRPWGADPDAAVGELARKARFSQHRLTQEERRSALARTEDERKRVLQSLSRPRRWLLRWVLGL